MLTRLDLVRFLRQSGRCTRKRLGSGYGKTYIVDTGVNYGPAEVGANEAHFTVLDQLRRSFKSNGWRAGTAVP